MKRGSFETINYALRPNKNVERKLIANTLIKLRTEFPVNEYRYIGFGSMWFSDFVLMHKLIGINDMVTIENQVSRKKRVEFNKPFACIAVRMEQASAALGEVIDSKRCFVWLDYDGPLKDAMTGDIETAVGGMKSGSLIAVTVNAHVDQLKGHKQEGDEVLKPEAFLAEICDDERLLTSTGRLTKNDFPLLVCELIHARLKASVLELNPSCEYVPIWTFRYSDGVAMITVGGMVANAEDRKNLQQSKVSDLPAVSPDKPFVIQLPVLTEKEKRALDKLLPTGKPLDCRKLDFELRDVEVAAYEQLYLHYPVFSEIST
jgi:hypothetical protein